jgi:hypothetical protein
VPAGYAEARCSIVCSLSWLVPPFSPSADLRPVRLTKSPRQSCSRLIGSFLEARDPRETGLAT